MEVVEVLTKKPEPSRTGTPPVNATAFDWPPRSGATLYGSRTTAGASAAAGATEATGGVAGTTGAIFGPISKLTCLGKDRRLKNLFALVARFAISEALTLINRYKPWAHNQPSNPRKGNLFRKCK